MALGGEDTIPFDQFFVETKKIVEPPRKSKYGRLPFARLDDPGPEHSFIIDDFLSAGDVSVIGGESQSGKSFLAIKAGMCIATGSPFFGREIVKAGLVIYQAGEGVLGIKKRLRAYRQHEGLDLGANVPFELLQSAIDLYHADGDTGALIEEIQWIAAAWPNNPLAAVFIDTLATATTGADEISGKDMGIVMANVKRIARECRTHVCLVHHMNAGGEKLRGHTSIKANIDQVIVVKRNKETGVRTAVLDKQKDEEDGQDFKFELKRVELGFTAKGKPITSCVCLHVGEKEAEYAAAKIAPMELRGNLHMAMSGLAAALKLYGRAPPAQIKCPVWAHAVTLANWRDEYTRLVEGEDEDPVKLVERVKKARDRAIEKALQYKLIEKDGEWVWRTKRKIKGIDQTSSKVEAEQQPAEMFDDQSFSPSGDLYF